MIEVRKEQVDLLTQTMAQRDQMMTELAKNSGGSTKNPAWLKFAESIPTVVAIVAMGMASHN